VVSSAKFGTRQNGTRSAPPVRLIPGITDQKQNPKLTLHENLNEQAAVMIQIETLAGIHNLDAILTEVPDIDVVWIGSLDARISMNLPGGLGIPMEEPEWKEALATFFATVKKHDKPYAGFSIGDSEQVRRDAEEQRMSVCFVGFDVLALMGMYGQLQGARESMKALVK
jgi:4-hydroxy-2-oxoheptanedioate aldolase